MIISSIGEKRHGFFTGRELTEGELLSQGWKKIRLCVILAKLIV